MYLSVLNMHTGKKFIGSILWILWCRDSVVLKVNLERIALIKILAIRENIKKTCDLEIIWNIFQMFWTNILLLVWTLRNRSLLYCCHFAWWSQVQVWLSSEGFRGPRREWQVYCTLMAFPPWLPHCVRGLNAPRFLLGCREVLLNLQGRSSWLTQAGIFQSPIWILLSSVLDVILLKPCDWQYSWSALAQEGGQLELLTFSVS